MTTDSASSTRGDRALRTAVLAGRAAAAAVSFLTRVRVVPRRVVLDAADVSRGAALFPLVGAAIGAAVAGVAVALHGPLTPLIAAAVAVAVAALLTGALHLDALADTADALGARSRAHALEIMRDHALGSYGTIAVVLDVLVKVAAIAALLERPAGMAAVVVALACSRAAGPALAAALPYARPHGTGAALGHVVYRSASGAVLAAIAGAALLLGLDALPVLAAVALVTIALGLAYRRWLGGFTGDTLGAATELSETAALVVAAAAL